MRIVGALLRIFSYLYHLLLSLLLVGLALIAITSGRHTLQLEMLPWSGRDLTLWLLGLGILGLFSTILAMFGKLRILFVAWALGVLFLLFRGFFLEPYSFAGVDEFRTAALLTAGALLAVIGSLTGFRRKRKRLR